MRFAAILGVGLAVGTSPALAADYGVPGDLLRGSIAEPTAPSRVWDGAYAGLFWGKPIHGDYQVTAGPLLEAVTGPGSYSTPVSGYEVGALVGYNTTWSGVLAGVEADLSLPQTRFISGFQSLAGEAELDIKTRYLATLRARFGVAAGDFLLYGTAGGAMANITSRLDATVGSTSYSSHDGDTVYGYALGAGIEYAFLERMSLRAEYLYTAFVTAGLGNAADVDLDYGSVRVGLIGQF